MRKQIKSTKLGMREISRALRKEIFQFLTPSIVDYWEKTETSLSTANSKRVGYAAAKETWPIQISSQNLTFFPEPQLKIIPHLKLSLHFHVPLQKFEAPEWVSY